MFVCVDGLVLFVLCSGWIRLREKLYLLLWRRSKMVTKLYLFELCLYVMFVIT